MTDEAREARREYWRQYYKTHKAECRERMDRYWQRRAEQAQEDDRAEDKTREAD